MVHRVDTENHREYHKESSTILLSKSFGQLHPKFFIINRNSSFLRSVPQPNHRHSNLFLDKAPAGFNNVLQDIPVALNPMPKFLKSTTVILDFGPICRN